MGGGPAGVRRACKWCAPRVVGVCVVGVGVIALSGAPSQVWSIELRLSLLMFLPRLDLKLKSRQPEVISAI